MNFDWEAEQSEIKEKVAGLFEEIPIRELDVTSDVQGLKKMMMGFLGKLAEIGYLGLGVGPEGQKDLVSLIAAQEALAGVSGSLFLAVETTARLFGGLVEGWGAEALKGEVTGPLQKGSLLTALAFADPPGGDEAKTVARQDGDVFVVSGKKDFVTNGPIADLIAVA
ncbi:MAG: hypothetical protein GY846_09420, partial [Deltaproteobacteria bacterium]|nr:hypothetical protein [Deltaproteobacteria bacterium]